MMMLGNFCAAEKLHASSLTDCGCARSASCSGWLFLRFLEIRRLDANGALRLVCDTAAVLRLSGRKMFPQHFGAKGEYFFHVGTHPAMQQEIKRHGVADMITRQGAAIAGFEGVL